MIKFLAATYLGVFLMMLTLAWWQGLWWEFLLIFLALWSNDIYKDMMKRKKVEDEINKYLKREQDSKR